MDSDRIVYIVDDDEAARLSTSFFLNAATITTKAFNSGQRFLATVERLEPGCVLLDLRMPGLDGFEVLKALAPLLARFPVIVMTGHGDVVTAVRAMKLGACDFVAKPFDGEDLLKILETTFSNLHKGMALELRRKAAAAKVSMLSRRETEVLGKMIVGKRSKEIAYELGVSIRTVDNQRAAIIDTLGVRTSAEALRLAVEAGIATEL